MENQNTKDKEDPGKLPLVRRGIWERAPFPRPYRTRATKPSLRIRKGKRRKRARIQKESKKRNR